MGRYSLCSVKFIKRNDLNFYALVKTISYNPKYPLIKDLRAKAKRRITKFAFEYLDGGCNKDINLYKNTSELRKVELKPKYLIPFSQSNLKTELFNHQFVVQFFEKQTNNSIFLNFIILTLIIISTTYLINFKKSMFEQKINNDQSKYYY